MKDELTHPRLRRIRVFHDDAALLFIGHGEPDVVAVGEPAAKASAPSHGMQLPRQI
jgi:hypothetical protein